MINGALCPRVSLARASLRARYCRPRMPRGARGAECLPRDVPRRQPPLVCRCWSLRRAEVCALIPDPAPRKHAPPRTVLPPLCLWGRGLCRAHRRIPPGIFGTVSVSIPGPSRRKPSAMRLTHGHWTSRRGAGHDKLARFGRIDRSIGEPPCALRCRRTDARKRREMQLIQLTGSRIRFIPGAGRKRGAPSEPGSDPSGGPTRPDPAGPHGRYRGRKPRR